MKTEQAKIVFINEDLVLVDKTEWKPEKASIYDDDMDLAVPPTRVLIGRALNFNVVIKPDVVIDDVPFVELVKHQTSPAQRDKEWNQLIVNVTRNDIDSAYFMHTIEAHHMKNGETLSRGEASTVKDIVKQMVEDFWVWENQE